MRKIEFLEQLQTELGDQLSTAELRSEIEYYSQYIEDEIAKGTPEETVLDDLGDPWAIAHNILDDKERREGKEAVRGEQAARDAGSDYQQAARESAERARAEREARADQEWARSQRRGGAGSYILVLVAVLLIIGVIISVVFGAMSFLLREMPVLFVIVVVWWVWRRLRY